MKNRSTIRCRLRGLAALALLVLISSVVACRPGVRSNFEVDRWAGTPLEAAATDAATASVRFAEIPNSAGLILNVYSPTCGPCIDELPALKLLHARARELGVPMFLIATAFPADHGLELDPGASRAERVQAIADRLRVDVARYGIDVPVVIMADDFRVSERDGLVTGTPETMFFRRSPLVLEYNFLGPISAGETPAEIESETRYKFALRILHRIRSAASSENESGPYDATGYSDSDQSRPSL